MSIGHKDKAAKSMPMKRDVLLPIALGFFLGTCISVIVWLGYKAVMDDTTLEKVTQGEFENRTSVDDLPQNLQLEQIIRIDSPFDRQHYVSTLSNKLERDQLLELVKESSVMKFSRRAETTQDLLISELAKIDAHTALEQIWSFPSARWKPLVSIVFSEWSKSDFDVALQHAMSLSGFLQHQAIETTIETRSDIPYAERLHQAQKHNIESIAQRVISIENARQLLHRPRSALSQILTDEIDNDLQLDVLIEIIHCWVASEDTSALVPILKALESHGETNLSLQDRLLFEAIKYDPQAAWDHVLNLTSEIQEMIQPAILDAWMNDNVNHVLIAVSQIKDPIRKRILRDYVMFHWPTKKPDKALENLDLVPQESRHVVIANAIRELARQEKFDNALEYVSQFDQQNEDTSRAKDYLISRWSQKDASEALAWVLENTTETSALRKRLLKNVLSQLALIDPSRAFSVALAQQVGESKRLTDHLEYWVIQSLASNGRFKDLEPMLFGVRDIARLPSFLMVGRNYIEFSQFNEAVSLADKLPKSTWPEYYGGLVSKWLSVDPQSLIAHMNRIPDPISQFVLSQRILQNHRAKEYLSSEELEYVSSFIEPDGGD